MSMINKHDEQAQQVYEQIVGIVGKARRCNLGMVRWGYAGGYRRVVGSYVRAVYYI